MRDTEDKVTQRLSDLWDQRQERRSWLDDHPEAERRLDILTADIAALDTDLAVARGAVHTRHPSAVELARAQVLDRGLDLGR